ncbi:MAG: hypothetical protein ACXVC0_22085 [Bdellovibrionota bacterium]
MIVLFAADPLDPLALFDTRFRSETDGPQVADGENEIGTQAQSSGPALLKIRFLAGIDCASQERPLFLFHILDCLEQNLDYAMRREVNVSVTDEHRRTALQA